MLRVEENQGWLVRGLLAAESNYRVAVHIRDLGVEKLGLKPIPDCEHLEFRKSILIYYFMEDRIFYMHVFNRHHPFGASSDESARV